MGILKKVLNIDPAEINESAIAQKWAVGDIGKYIGIHRDLEYYFRVDGHIKNDRWDCTIVYSRGRAIALDDPQPAWPLYLGMDDTIKVDSYPGQDKQWDY